MADVTRRIRETTDQTPGTQRVTREVESPREEADHRKNVAVRIVWFITGTLLVLLGTRFVFALLGANPANGLASFVYGVTQPLVAPFFGLFNYNYDDGVRRFESYTLVAMAFYALLAYGLSRLMTLTKR